MVGGNYKFIPAVKVIMVKLDVIWSYKACYRVIKPLAIKKWNILRQVLIWVRSAQNSIFYLICYGTYNCFDTSDKYILKVSITISSISKYLLHPVRSENFSFFYFLTESVFRHLGNLKSQQIDIKMISYETKTWKITREVT